MKEPGLYGANIKLPSLDNLFSTEEERQDAKLERIQIVELDQLHPFENHPYQVKDDEEMQKLAESIRDCGVMNPAIVRPRSEGGYEVISGHRRLHACTLSGRKEMPVIIRDMDEDTAIIAMVDSNQQRENILPSEKAKAYQMKLNALKRQGKRREATSRQVVGKLETADLVGGETGDSGRQVQRYIRLNELIPELQQMVDDGKLKFNPAVELSYLNKEEQQEFMDYIVAQDCTPSLSQAQKLKKASQEKSLTQEGLERIMTAQSPSVKPQEIKLNIPVSRVERYFPKGITSDQMVNQIVRILEEYYRNRHRGRER